MVMAAPGILQAVICLGKVQKRNMYIPTSQPAMPMQVRQDFQRTSFRSVQELEAYTAQAKALSLFETGITGAGCETTLTLVTCSYEWKEARNILVAVKTEPER